MKTDNAHHSPAAGESHGPHAFDDPTQAARRLDASERDEWQKPADVIASFHLSADATIVDLGAGTGYFTIRLAPHVKNGQVIAVDAEPKMVAYLKERAAQLGLTNIAARLAPPGGQVDLPAPVDLVLCVDTYHHLAERVAYFAPYRRQLKAGGRVVIIDHAARSQIGSAQHRLPPETVKAEMHAAGFALVADLDFLPYQFYLVFAPAAAAQTGDTN